MVRILWLGWILWRRLEILVEGYKTGSTAKSQALARMLGTLKELAEPLLLEIEEWLS